MAARKKSTARGAARKKSARKGSATGRKKAVKKPAPKKSTRSSASARKATPRKAAPRKAAPRKSSRPVAKRPATPSIESIARLIVKAARDIQSVKIEDLYAPECSSREPGGGAPAEGVEGVRAKAHGFEAMVESTEWKVKNQWLKPNRIAIEWDAKIRFKNGRTVELEEMAVHELRGGKIVAERYYYDPAVLAAAMAPEEEPEPAPRAEPEPTPEPVAAPSPPVAAAPETPKPSASQPRPPISDPDDSGGPSGPPPDPMDL